MDRYAVRLLLTAVMFGAVTVSATLFSDALAQTAESEPLSVPGSSETEERLQPNSTKTAYLVSVHTQACNETVAVLDEDGRAVAFCRTDAQKSGSVGPLEPGRYYAKAASTGYVSFTLADNAAVSVQAGSGWADGERLYFTAYEPAQLELTCEVPNGFHSAILTVTLRDEAGQKTEQTAYITDGEACFVFDGLCPGTYRVCHGETELAAVQIDGQTSLTVTLS